MRTPDRSDLPVIGVLIAGVIIVILAWKNEQKNTAQANAIAVNNNLATGLGQEYLANNLDAFQYGAAIEAPATTLTGAPIPTYGPSNSQIVSNPQIPQYGGGYLPVYMA